MIGSSLHSAFTGYLLIAIAASSVHGTAVSKRQVSADQQQCFSLLLTQLTNRDNACIGSGSVVTSLLGNNDVRVFLGLGQSNFAEFCRPSCGRQILNAWEACNITKVHREEIELYIQICGNGRDGRLCFKEIESTMEFITSVENCYNGGLFDNGQCSDECRNLINEGEDMYRCCINAAVEFIIATPGSSNADNLKNVVQETFNRCFETLREQCVIPINVTLGSGVDGNNQLSPSQLVCISDSLLTNSDIDNECRVSAGRLAADINSKETLLSLSNDLSPLTTFCTPSCGPVVIDTWKACGAYVNLKPEVDFLAGLCNIDGNSTCYSRYHEDILQFLDDTVHCVDLTQDETVCPTGCYTSYRNGIANLGCCTEVLVGYANAIVTDVEVDEVINTLYGACELQRPRKCSMTDLNSTDFSRNCPGSSSAAIALSIMAVGFMAIANFAL